MSRDAVHFLLSSPETVCEREKRGREGGGTARRAIRSALFSLFFGHASGIAKIEGVQELPRLLSLIASQSGNLVNMSSLARDAGLVMMTLKRYLALLEAIFLSNDYLPGLKISASD